MDTYLRIHPLSSLWRVGRCSYSWVIYHWSVFVEQIGVPGHTVVAVVASSVVTPTVVGYALLVTWLQPCVTRWSQAQLGTCAFSASTPVFAQSNLMFNKLNFFPVALSWGNYIQGTTRGRQMKRYVLKNRDVHNRRSTQLLRQFAAS